MHDLDSNTVELSQNIPSDIRASSMAKSTGGGRGEGQSMVTIENNVIDRRCMELSLERKGKMRIMRRRERMRIEGGRGMKRVGRGSEDKEEGESVNDEEEEEDYEDEYEEHKEEDRSK